MKLRNLPNLICVVRVLLIFPVVSLLLSNQFNWALGIFCIAAISDGVDGFLAKNYGWESPLGSLLDPLADKLLLVSVYIASGIQGLVPSWLVVVVILRDVIIAVGALIYHYRVEPLVGQPLFSSKVNTLLQFILIIAVMVDIGVYPLSDALITSLIGSVFVTTVWSGYKYVFLWFSHVRYRTAFKSGTSR